MKKYNAVKAAVWTAASLAFIGLFGSLPDTPKATYAMAISDELMQKALEEEFGGMEDLEQIPDDYYDMDIDQFTEEYLEKIERGEVTFDELGREKIVNPPLTMKMVQNGNIRYTLPNGDYYEVNVPNGTITERPVIFDPSADVVAVVTKDGESSSLFNSWHFSEPGNYQIKLVFYQFEAEGAEDLNVYEVNHYFTITGSKINNIGAVPAPDGFEIISAKRDGVPLTIDNPKCLFLGGDGKFEIRYRDTATGSIYATSSFNRDTTAPFLTFSKEIAEGEVEGPVEFYTGDIKDKVYTFYNGHSGEAVTNELSIPGDYVLKVVDDAGNGRIYSLKIKQTYRILEPKTIILALVLLLGAGASLLFLRRDTKVI